APHPRGALARYRPFVVAADRPVGIAVTAQVGRHHGEALGERGHHLAPHVAGLRIAVEQDHPGALPELSIMDAGPVAHAHHVADHRWSSARSRGSQPRTARACSRSRYPQRLSETAKKTSNRSVGGAAMQSSIIRTMSRWLHQTA